MKFLNHFKAQLRFLGVIALLAELIFPPALFTPLLTGSALAIEGPALTPPAWVEETDREYEDTLNALQETWDGKRIRHPLDLWRLLDQETFSADHDRLQAATLQFVWVGSNGQELTLNEKEATRAISAPISGTLEIRFRGEIIHRFRGPIESFAWVSGRYLVFTESGRTEESDDTGRDSSALQEVSFIDFQKYRKRIGLGEDGAVPVFKFYRQLEKGSTHGPAVLSSGADQNAISVRGNPITSGALEIYSDAEEVLFNNSVHLAQPSFFEKASRTISDLGVFFDAFLESAGQSLQDQVGSANEIRKLFAERQIQLKAQSQAAPTALAQIKTESDARSQFEKDLESQKPGPWKRLFQSVRSWFKKTPQEAAPVYQGQPFAPEAEIAALLQKSAALEKNQNQFFTRLRLAWAKLSLPEPEGPSRLREALAWVSSGASRKSQGFLKAARILLSRDGLIDLVKTRAFKMGAGVGAAFLAGVIFPEETAQFLYQGLDIARTTFDIALHRGLQLKEVAGVASEGTFGWLRHPSILSDAYLSAETLPKLGIGLTAILTALYLALGVPHVVVNVHKLAKDFNKDGTWSEFLAWLAMGQIHDASHYLRAIRNLGPAFIRRQEREQKLYLQILADAEAAVQGDAAAKEREFTSEQTERLKGVLERLNEQDQNGWSRALDRIKNTAFFKRFFDKGVPAEKHMTLAGAFRHFFLSLASFTNAGYAYTHIWQAWFRFRAMLWSPTQLVTNWIYPQYSQVVGGADRDVHPPSIYNGGLTPRFERLSRWLKNEYVMDELIDQWEEQVLPVEAKIHRAAVQSSFLAVAREFGEKRETLTHLFSGSGIQGINDSTLQTLSQEARLYFRVHYEMTQDRMMRKFVASLLREKNPELSGIQAASRASSQNLNEIKQDTLEVLKQSPWLEESDEQIGARVRTLTDSSEFRAQVAQEVRSGYLSLTGWSARVKHYAFKVYDPRNNPQIRRMHAVERQVKNPRAMARAVRAMVASNVVDKPMELAFAFLFLAGVSDPLLKPIQDQLFSDTSTFYLSKVSFWSGFVMSTILGAIGDTWVKLQQDEMHEGHFDHVPDGPEEKNLSYLHYYWKRFTEANNTLWKNQRHYFKIILPNILPALTTYVVSNLLTLGRFDFDMWFMGYFMFFVLWTGGLASKIEQAYELSTGWFAKEIPADLRAHPLAQEYLGKRTGTARIRFNFLYKIYENILGYFLGTLEMVGAPGVGNRALTRIFGVGGFTPTEWIAHGAAQLRGMPGVPKMVSGMVDTCVYLLTNKYVGLKDPSTGKEFTKDRLPGGQND